MSQHHTINYIELPVKHLSEAKAFYAAVFGWTFTDYGPNYASFSGAGIDGGFDGDAGRVCSDQGALPVIFSDDLDATEAAVKAAGGTITIAQFDFPGGRRFHFTDPQGNGLAVWKTA
ncbi:VOC family protein [Litorimonas sp. RW-G-Af-16]|uniref:VOC family protein n=1 Tax=Litorimonas sp. RW-G-Af-16 TaxID=3241168 RepID=UPI00390CB926